MAKKRKVNVVSQQEVLDAFVTLKLHLRAAYWSTPDEDTGDKITAAADACSDIATALIVADIKSRTQDYKDLSEKVDLVIKRLNEIKKNIDTMIRAIDVSIKVAKGIDQALKAAASFVV